MPSKHGVGSEIAMKNIEKLRKMLTFQVSHGEAHSQKVDTAKWTGLELEFVKASKGERVVCKISK